VVVRIWCDGVRICVWALVLRDMSAKRCGGGDGKANARDQSCCGHVEDVESLPRRAMHDGGGVLDCRP
jgi:hypothetical protein